MYIIVYSLGSLPWFTHFAWVCSLHKLHWNVLATQFSFAFLKAKYHVGDTIVSARKALSGTSTYPK